MYYSLLIIIIENIRYFILFVCSGRTSVWRYPVSVPYLTAPSNTAGHNICWLPYLSRTVFVVLQYYVYDSLIFWKEIGRRGGNAIRMDVSCRIGDRMRQQKHTLEERSRRLQNKRERSSERRSEETSEERSRRLLNARDRQSQRRSQDTSGHVRTDIPSTPLESAK